MSCTIGFWHFRTGESLSLDLYPVAGGVAVNGSEGDPFSEPNSSNVPGYYEATVAEALDGAYIARVRRGASAIYQGQVFVTAEADSAIIDATQTANVVQLLGTNLGESPAGVLSANFGTFFNNGGDLSERLLDDLGGEGGTMTVSAFTQSALAQLAQKRAIFISVPSLIGRQLSDPIVQGDSYLAEHARALEFARSDFPDLPPEATARLTARCTDSGVTATFTLDAEIVTPTEVKTIRVEATSAQTREFVPGRYEFDVEVVFPDGNVATFVGPGASLRVIADVSDN